MPNYRKKPVVIEAIEFSETNLFDVITFIDGRRPDLKSNMALDTWSEYESWVIANKGLFIETLEGSIFASMGDYIIKGVKGEFYPCKPDIFALTYDEVMK